MQCLSTTNARIYNLQKAMQLACMSLEFTNQVVKLWFCKRAVATINGRSDGCHATLTVTKILINKSAPRRQKMRVCFVFDIPGTQ